MNEIVNEFLLAGDKFMPEMHLKQPGFTYSACRPFTKNKERIQKFKERGGSSYIYKNKADKACFQHDMAYKNFKDLARRTASDKLLLIKHLILLKVLNIMDIKEDFLLWFTNFLTKKTVSKASFKNVGSGVNIPLESNEELAEELQKPIIRKFKKRAVYSRSKDNIWGADLADMQLISKFNKGFRFLLCVIDIFSKYSWVVPLKNKKGVTITMRFKKY